MKTKLTIQLASALLLGLTSLSSQAAIDLELIDLSFSYNNGITTPAVLPGDDNQIADLIAGGADLGEPNPFIVDRGTVEYGGLLSPNPNSAPVPEGLGFLTASIVGQGTYAQHQFNAFFNHDIFDLGPTGPNGEYWLNETVATSGTLIDNLVVGQTFETGDLTAFQGNQFDVFSPLSGLNDAFLGGDTFMALGYDFFLGVGDVAEIIFEATTIAPDSGFYLTQTDAFNGEQFYLTSSLTINGLDARVVPEPSIIFLMGLGLAGLVATRRRQLKIA